MKIPIKKDISEVVFRILFSTIFLGLGAEHLFSDELIQRLMPLWMPQPRMVSLLCGAILISGGGMILLGYKVRRAAILLGVFVITVTALVHLPALFSSPHNLPEQWQWLWTVLQRSNFVKNVCLLGVCFHLLYHRTGKYSADAWMAGKRET